MASGVYNIFKSEVMKGTCNLGTDTLKVALLTSSHSFAASSVTNDTWADISANEVSGTGYTAGGATLTSLAVTVDNTDNEGVFDAADVTWSSSTITARYAVIYDDTVTSPADMIIACFDFGSDQSSSSGDFTIQWSAEGILNLN